MKSLTVTLASMALVLGMAVTAHAQKLAIANPAKILNDIQETKDLNQKIQNDIKTLEAESQARQEKLKGLQAARDALKTDSPQYAERNKELLQGSIELQTWGQLQDANLKREQKLQMRSLFNKITQTVAEVATQKGIDLVLAEQRPELPENIDGLDMNQLRGLILQRNVLFSTATTDITADVIAALDAKYKAGN